MDFDVQGIRTVANTVLASAAEDLRVARLPIVNANLAWDPFADTAPEQVSGQRMFAELDSAWNEVCTGLLALMEDSAAGIDYTAGMLNQMANQYEANELSNTEKMHRIANEDLPDSRLRSTLDGGVEKE